ncbi:Acid phosphatase-like protein 2, partial [Nosema bombycis CQ1]
MKLLLLIFVVHSINWNIGKGKGDRGGKKNKPGKGDSSKDYPKTKIPVKDLKEDMGYCQAKYQFFPKKENFNLERVVVIFRHGDRSPMKNNNDEWKKKTCVECPMNGNTITECRNKKCENGELTTKGKDPKRISEKADEIRCSMCNSVSVTCADEDCQNDTLPEIVKLSNSMWKKQVQAVVASDLGKKIIFGRFARDLLEILSSNKLMYLVSAHDGTLSMILSSLSDESYAWPPYASALFIEVWCKYGKQFVRLVYNDKKVEFTEKPGEYIPINEFTSYLERMKAEDRELDNLCRSGGSSGNKSRLKADLQDNKSKILLDVPLF